jgi:hypothetical protein
MLAIVVIVFVIVVALSAGPRGWLLLDPMQNRVELLPV